MKESIALASIDWTPARSVRARSDAETVESYKEAYLALDDMPPIVVFRGGGKLFAGDGGHRGDGAKAAGFKEIDAIVRDCSTAELADNEAHRFAASANSIHGLRRTQDDKRAAVEMMLGRPENDGLSDSELARLCNVFHPMVRQARERLDAAGKLGEKAAERIKKYKPNIVYRGGAVTDGKGGTVRVPSPKPKAEDRPSDTPPPEEAVESPLAEYRKFHREPPTEELRDAKGRPVPTRLAGAFAGSPKFKSWSKVVGDLIAEIHTDTGPHMAAAFPNDVIARLDDARKAILSGSPFVVCPECGDLEDPKCGCCTGRGWVTKGGFTLLTAKQKQTVKEWEDSFRNGHPNHPLDTEAA